MLSDLKPDETYGLLLDEIEEHSVTSSSFATVLSRHGDNTSAAKHKTQDDLEQTTPDSTNKGGQEEVGKGKDKPSSGSTVVDQADSTPNKAKDEQERSASGNTSANSGEQEKQERSASGNTSANSGEQEEQERSASGNTSANSGEQEEQERSASGNTSANSGEQEEQERSASGNTSANGGELEEQKRSASGNASANSGEQEEQERSASGNTSANSGEQEEQERSASGNTSANSGEQEEQERSASGNTSANSGELEEQKRSASGNASANGGEQEGDSDSHPLNAVSPSHQSSTKTRNKVHKWYTKEDLAKLRKDVGAALNKPGDKTFIDMLDCGGQLSFSVCQTITFSAEQSIFILAYNSSIGMDEAVCSEFRQGGKAFPVAAPHMTNETYLRLWLSTLYMLKKPDRRLTVFVVGTRLCQLKREGPCEPHKERVKEVLSDFKELDIRGPYLVDNKEADSNEWKNFRKVLLEIMNDQAKRNSREVKLSHLMCEWCIRQKKKANVTTKKEFKKFAADVTDAKMDDKEINSLLDYLHKNCAVRYFDLTDHKQAEPTIYLNVRWLLQQVCKLLSCTMEDSSRRIYNDDDIEDLKTKGILTGQLADDLWPAKDDDTRQLREDILLILEKLGMLCKVPEEVKKKFTNARAAGSASFVPICMDFKDSQIPKECRGYDAMPYLILRLPAEIFPYGEFSRLLVRVLQAKQPSAIIEMNQHRLCFRPSGFQDPYAVDIKHIWRGIALCVYCATPSMATGVKDDTMATCATKFFEIVLRQLESILKETSGDQSGRLKASFYCQDHKGKSKAGPFLMVLSFLAMFRTKKLISRLGVRGLPQSRGGGEQGQRSRWG